MTAAEILAGRARLVRMQPRAVAIWGLLYVVLCIAMLLTMRPMFADMMALQQQAMAARSAGLPPPEPEGIGRFILAILLIDAALLIVFAAIFAAVVRAVARIEAGESEGDRFGFLRLGMDEARLIALALLLAILFFIATFVIGLAAGFAVVAVVSLAGAGSDAAAAAASFIITLVLLVLMVWAQVRLSLSGALTVLRGRIVVREAWRLTRGHFWTLFGVYLLIGVGYVALSLLLFAIASPGLLAAYVGGMQPAALQAALAEQQALFAHPFAPRLILTWLIGGLVMTVGVAFVFGAIVTAAIGFDRERAD